MMIIVCYFHLFSAGDDVLCGVACCVLFQSAEMISGLCQLLKTNPAVSELVLSNVGLKW